MSRQLGNISRDLGQIMRFLVNAFPPKPFNIAASNFAVEVEGYWATLRVCL